MNRYQADIRDITSGLYRSAPRDLPLCTWILRHSPVWFYAPIIHLSLLPELHSTSWLQVNFIIQCSGPVCCPYLCFHMASRRSHFYVDNHGRVLPLPHKCSSLDADSKPPVVEWLGGNVLTTYLCIEFVTQQCLFKTASWELSGPG